MPSPVRIYLASSWRNVYQAQVLAELRAAGFEVYDFKNPAPGNQGFGWRQTIDRPIATAADLLEALAHPRAVEGFKFDFDAMKWADVCVLLLPSGNSAHLEAGWMAGHGKHSVVLAPELKEPELMYKCFDDEVGSTPLFMTTDQVIRYLNTWNERRDRAPQTVPDTVATDEMLASFAKDAQTLLDLGVNISIIADATDDRRIMLRTSQPYRYLTDDEAEILASMLEAMVASVRAIPSSGRKP